MAYDSSSSQLVLFGGNGSLYVLDDTWTWNGATWTQLSPATSPAATAMATMAYDGSSSDLVLFGGWVNGYSSETWTWNGSTWTQLFPSTSPSARFQAAMATDPDTNEPVLFGGDGAGGADNDTWTLLTTPSVTVANNSGVAVGGTLTFTSAVAGPTGDPTPTGSLAWAVTAPGGESVPCTSTTGPSGSSNVATFTCSITGAVHGTYSASAT